MLRLETECRDGEVQRLWGSQTSEHFPAGTAGLDRAVVSQIRDMFVDETDDNYYILELLGQLKMRDVASNPRAPHLSISDPLSLSLSLSLRS